MYGRGFIPDPAGYVSTPFFHLKSRFRDTGNIRGYADLSPFAPPVMDQGTTSSCVGHGTSGGGATSLAAVGKPLGWVPSPRGVYTLGRCIDRRPLHDGSLPPLTDEGAQPNQAIRGIQEWGVKAMRFPTSDGRFSDCEADNINEEPDLGGLEEDSKVKLLGAYSIHGSPDSIVHDVCIALDNGSAVGVGYFVDSAFEKWDPQQGVVEIPHTSDPNGGGHWVYCYGYKEQAGDLVFLCRNSWGTNWGKNGDFEASSQWMKASIQRYAFALRGVFT